MQYMDQIDILRGFIKSEQVGNWVMQVHVFLQAYDGWQEYSKSPDFC